MRRLLLALPFALLPLAAAQAHDESAHAHGSLGAHEHGVSHLDAALDGQSLELQLDGPAMNLVGFEHAASTPADQTKVAAARQQLENPLALFALPAAAGCKVANQTLTSPLFGNATAAHDHDDDDDDHDGHEHADIQAHYRFDCAKPDALERLDLTQVFKTFPGTHQVKVQLIGRQGQQGADLSAEQPSLAF